MKILILGLTAVAPLLLSAPAPAMAIGTPTNRLSNAELSHLRGGLPDGAPRAHLFDIVRDATTQDFQTIDSATGVAFDNWLATTGVQLIAANAYGLPPGVGR